MKLAIAFGGWGIFQFIMILMCALTKQHNLWLYVSLSLDVLLVPAMIAGCLTGFLDDER